MTRLARMVAGGVRDTIVGVAAMTVAIGATWLLASPLPGVRELTPSPAIIGAGLTLVGASAYWLSWLSARQMILAAVLVNLLAVVSASPLTGGDGGWSGVILANAWLVFPWLVGLTVAHVARVHASSASRSSVHGAPGGTIRTSH